LERGVRYQQVPDNSLKSFGMRSDPVRMDNRDEYAGIGQLGCIAAVAANNADDARARRFRIIERGDDIGADVPFKASTSDRKHQNGIAGAEPADLQPIGKYGGPAIVIDPGGQFGNIVGWSIGLDP